MAIMRAAGRGAAWLGRGAARGHSRSMDAFGRHATLMTAGAVGAAGAAGFVRGFSQSSTTGDIQEQFLGDRKAVQAVLRGSAAAAISPRDDIMGMGDSYYGQNVAFPSPKGFGPDGSPKFASNVSSGRSIPVGGEIVFGQYNMRR